MLTGNQYTAFLFFKAPLKLELTQQAFMRHKALICPNSEYSLYNVSEDNLKQYSTCLGLNFTIKNTEQDTIVWREAFDDFASELKVDYCLLESTRSVNFPKLVVFDMDSTLIPMEVIDELAAEAGVKEDVEKITEAAMRGELDFDESFEKRLSLLAGMPRIAVEKVQQRITLNPGVSSLTSYLSAKDTDIAIASGGFKAFAKQVAGLINVDTIAANELAFDQENVLTGIAEHPIVNAEYKAEMLKRWQQQRSLTARHTLAVGDGANDYLMMKAAGFGVAYKAKPFLRHRANCILQFAEMDALIDIIEVITGNCD